MTGWPKVSVVTLVQLFKVLRSRIPGRHLPSLSFQLYISDVSDRCINECCLKVLDGPKFKRSTGEI